MHSYVIRMHPPIYRLLLVALVVLVTLALSILTACSSDDNDTRGDDREDISSQPPAQDENDLTESSTQGGESDSMLPTSSDDDVDEREEDLSLSGVLYGFTFKLDGDTITLPITLGDFQSLGWELHRIYTLPETLKGRTVMERLPFTRDDKEIPIAIVNLGEDELPIYEVMVYRIRIQNDREYNPVIELPKGITIGISTKDDVIEAFGWPTNIFSRSGGEEVLDYENEQFSHGFGWGPSSNRIRIIIDPENNVISEIEIENIS